MLTKKVILDVDGCIDDAVAVTMALFDPALDVVAVTAAGGTVSAEQATRNVQTIIEQLDPPRLPRVGEASEPEAGLPARNFHLFGPQGLGNVQFPVSQLQHRHASEKLICDEVKSAPDQVTLLCLAPLTNVARCLVRDPAVASTIGQLFIAGGAIATGNVTPAAEFNIYCDPSSAKLALHSALTKTMVPLDVSTQVTFTYDWFDQLPGEDSRAGRFLRKILPFAFRSYRQSMGIEGIHLHDVVTLVAAQHPELFEIEMTAVDVEISGDLTTGATIFDRRPVREWRNNVAIATCVDAAGVLDCVLRSLKTAGELSAD